jgi:hypothetical protein
MTMSSIMTRTLHEHSRACNRKNQAFGLAGRGFLGFGAGVSTAASTTACATFARAFRFGFRASSTTAISTTGSGISTPIRASTSRAARSVSLTGA